MEGAVEFITVATSRIPIQNLRNRKKCLKMLTETLLRIPLSVIGRCSLVPTCHWPQGKCARINLSHAASGMILQNHRRLYVSIFSVKIAVAGCLKEFIGRIFKISKDQAKTSVWFFRQLKSGKLSAHAQKVPIYYYQPPKKYSSLDTILLKKQKF
jgi:hypothetical protein